MKPTKSFDPKTILIHLPDSPGVYQYFDEKETVIYVGKAKNLKNRVSSYFTKTLSDEKTKRLVSQIRRIEYILVPTEFDALLLENTLIKKYLPKFNILLKDDKTYPFLCLTNDLFPKLITIRQIDKSLGKVYGPFANQKAMYAILDFIKALFPIRTCSLHLTAPSIEKKKFKLCLEYHLGNCKAPCEGLQSAEDYQIMIRQVELILKGNIAPVKTYFEAEMHKSAEKLAFEEAHLYKERWQIADQFQSKHTVVNPSIEDVDIYAITSDETCAYISFLKVVRGTIMQSQTVEIKKKLNETDADILTLMVWEMRERYESEASEILTNSPLSMSFSKIITTVPQIGDKRKLVDMALKNVLHFKREKANQQAAMESGGDRKMRVLLKLKNDLRLQTLPRRIECFDNSNLQGTNPVSAMVCFIEAAPAKKEYRHFIPKTIEGIDDFGTMKEIVGRRYRRVKDENLPLPDLIIVDGGKGQLSAVMEALKELELYGKIPLVGIAKRLEEIYLPEDSIPLYIDKKSESLLLIQRIRDEAHRFGITHHRDKRSKALLQNYLETIEGIGKITTNRLLNHFHTLQNIKEATYEQLVEVVGVERASKIIGHFQAME